MCMLARHLHRSGGLSTLGKSLICVHPLSKLYATEVLISTGTQFRCNMSLHSESKHQPTTCTGATLGEAEVDHEAGSSEGQIKEECDESSHVEIQEGQARILFPNSNQVFYNPVQEFNRDLRYARRRWMVLAVYMYKNM